MSCHAGGFMGYGSSFFGVGSLMPLLFFGLIAFIAYKFFSNMNTNRTDNRNLCSDTISSAHGSSMEVLNRKFASGEISESEYLRKKDLLRQ